MSLSVQRRKVRLGYIPLVDAAPILMADEMGLFRRHGVEVLLSREIGWATIRDKLTYGELDAAHALGVMALSMNLGLGGSSLPCVSGLILNTNGNAVTLSEKLWALGVRDGKGFADHVRKLSPEEAPTLGVPFYYSSHHYLLHKWLRGLGLNPAHDVRIVVVPPPQMSANLTAGHLDGYCVGEPWNSLSIQSGAGWCVQTGRDIAPDIPEKILLARTDFAMEREAEHAALIRALLEACEFCQNPVNRPALANLLSETRHLNTSGRAVRNSLIGPFQLGHSRKHEHPDFIQFAGSELNRPSPEIAACVRDQLTPLVQGDDATALQRMNLHHVFRPDLFDHARTSTPFFNQTPSTKLPHETKRNHSLRLTISA